MSVLPERMTGEAMAPVLIALIEEFIDEAEIEERKLMERRILSATLIFLGLKWGRGGPFVYALLDID